MKTLSTTFVKKIKKVLKDENINDIETDVLVAKDVNHFKYLYLHFKSREFSVQDDNVYVSAILLLNKNKIKYHICLESDDKCLVFVPYNQTIGCLVEEEPIWVDYQGGNHEN